MVAANFVPATRCKDKACEETSITTALHPRSNSLANDRCRSVASGVVRAPERVPKTAVAKPCWRNTDASRCAVVVLPLVPVMPITFNFELGRPKNSAAK